MRTKIGCVAILAGMMGIVTEAAAAGENYAIMAGQLSLSPIIAEGEELMFTMDVPYVLARDTPIVLAQATASGSTAPQPDYILQQCQETESTGDPRSAMHAVDPAGWLGVYIENRDKRVVDFASIKNVTLLESTTHGKITAEVDNIGLVSYRYDPAPNYVGNDKAVFMAEFEGKVYKIVINLVVSIVVDESPLLTGQTPVCPTPQLIKVNRKPVSGSSRTIGDRLS